MHQSPRARDRYILQIYLPSQTRALYVHCVWQASLLSPPASLLGRQIMNGLVVYRCLLLTQRRLAALVRSAQHLTTYPFLPSLSLPAREKSPELTLIFLRLRQTGTGGGSGFGPAGGAVTTFCMCANLVFHSRPPPPHPPQTDHRAAGAEERMNE